MQAVLYSHARNNLRNIINQVCDNFEEFIITTKEKQCIYYLQKTIEIDLYKQLSKLKMQSF